MRTQRTVRSGTPGRTTDQLTRLRSLGVAVAMDDFGTGYSSLSSLKQLPLDSLKFDRVYFEDLRAMQAGEAIARGLVALAREYRMTVTAEGVESGAQADFLRAVGCDALQGYWAGLPVSPADFSGILIADRERIAVGAH